MKNYRLIVPVTMVILMVISWYMLISDAIETDLLYKTYLTEARTKAKDGITKYAIEYYNLALDIKNTPEINAEVAEYYKSQGMNNEYLSWSENFFETYPTNAKAYDCILEAYLAEQDYEECYDILEIAQKRSINSDYIEKVKKDIQYAYKLDYSSFDDVGIFINGFCSVKEGDFWGFVDVYGTQQISSIYKQVSGFSENNIVAVVDKNNEAYFIDSIGDKIKVSKEKYLSFGMENGNIFTAKNNDNKYIYVDKDFNKLFGEYDYASTMNEGIAAVKNGKDWHLINDKGKKVSDSSYLDVKLNENNEACVNNRLFVSSSKGKYIMIDKSGKRIGNLEFDDAKVFSSDAPAAVKIKGHWLFIDSKGKLISKKYYDDARSFSNGLAAVCINGKWGFVDIHENLVIDTQYFGAKDFNDKGSCFVQTGDKWQLLKLYRLNR